MRVKVVAGYDLTGHVHVLHKTKKEADLYYQKSKNIHRVDFYSVYPEQLEYLSMASAIDFEDKMTSAKKEKYEKSIQL